MSHSETDSEFYATPRQPSERSFRGLTAEPRMSALREGSAIFRRFSAPPAFFGERPPRPRAEPKGGWAAASMSSSSSAKDEPADPLLDTSVDDVFSYARHNRVEDVDRLLLRGLSPDTRDLHGNTILIIASQNNHKRVAKAALRRGSDINAVNYRGNTCLHFCFAYGFNDLGDYLISKGADPTIRNNANLSCYEGLSK